MSLDVTTETVIVRPVEVVARYAADPSNAPEWYANIDSVEWKSDPVVEKGAKAAFVARSSAAASSTPTSSSMSRPAPGW